MAYGKDQWNRYCDGFSSALGRTSGTVTVTVEGPFINWRLMGPCSIFFSFFCFSSSYELANLLALGIPGAVRSFQRYSKCVG